MRWDRLAALVRRRPRRVLGLSLALLIPPALGLPALRSSFDLLGELPASADSVRGFRALDGSFEPGQVQPLIVILDSERKVWDDSSFAAIDDLTVNLRKIPGVAGVRSITRPTGGRITAEQLEAVGLGSLADLPRQLPRAARGLGLAVGGLRKMRDGLERIRAGVPGQREDVAAGLSGIEDMRAGLGRILGGLDQIEDGLAEASGGLRRLAAEVAAPALADLEAAWEDLRDTTTARTDPQYEDLVRHVGEALGAISGRCPDALGIGPQPADCPAGKKIDPEYDGLGPTLRQVADGLDGARGGVGRVADGLRRIDAGLAEFASGLAAGGPDLDRLEDGVGRMVDGLDRIVPGLRRLRRALAVGMAKAQEAGLLPDPRGELALSASLVQAFPRLRRQLTLFVGAGSRATRLFVTLEIPPYGARALAMTGEVRELSRLSLRDSPLQEAEVLVAGPSALFADVDEAQSRDFRTIIWVVILGILLVLAGLLRSVVAPVYLMLTVLLSFASTLGLTVIVFQGVLGEPGLVWWLPPFLFVILVALGADYNIFLTSRIREEAERTDTRDAAARGLAATGHVITSAGLILAGTFSALLISPLGGLVQMGFAATAGILIDTFVVRSLLVPSVAVLLGSWSWWPSARSRRP